MPSPLDDSHSRIRAHHHPILRHRAGADADEGAEVVVEGIHLGLLAGREAVEVRDAPRSRSPDRVWFRRGT